MKTLLITPRGSGAVRQAALVVIEAVGFILLVTGPLLAILLVRTRGKVRPLTAYLAAIAGAAFGVGALALSMYVEIQWKRAYSTGGEFVMIGGPSAGRHFLAIGLLLLFACLVASLFLLVQWSVGRLTGAWSRREV